MKHPFTDQTARTVPVGRKRTHFQSDTAPFRIDAAMDVILPPRQGPIR